MLFTPENPPFTSQIYRPPTYDLNITYSFPDKAKADKSFDVKVKGVAKGKNHDENFPIARSGP